MILFYIKTYLKIDEIGTEASVTSISNLGSAAMKLNEVEMKVNRPFILVIKSNELPKNNDILFMAKIEEIDNN